jgi:HlyD family secretion protein
VLTPAQRTRFEHIRQRMTAAARTGQVGRVFVLGADRKPEAITLRIGASDGIVTEVLSGPIEAGRELIVGGGPRDAPASGPTFGGPRFGL